MPAQIFLKFGENYCRDRVTKSLNLYEDRRVSVFPDCNGQNFAYLLLTGYTDFTEAITQSVVICEIREVITSPDK
jgi:hypothetical protein